MTVVVYVIAAPPRKARYAMISNVGLSVRPLSMPLSYLEN